MKFATPKVPFSRIFGMVTGIQKQTTDGLSQGTKRLIDEAYMNDVSIPYGSPRKHAWSNAVCWS